MCDSKLRVAIASCDVRVRTHFFETCDVRACGTFLDLRCAITTWHVLKKNGLEVTEHLESNPNIPKPSCDDAFIDKLDLPISSSRVYVPAGDMVKISCDTKHRLVVNVTHHVNIKNCYGDLRAVEATRMRNVMCK